MSSVKEIKNIRQLWVDMANKALAEHDLTPLDARSFRDQGLDRLPTIKMGVDATNMERKGINTDKGNENRAISIINKRKQRTEANEILNGQLQKVKNSTESLEKTQRSLIGRLDALNELSKSLGQENLTIKKENKKLIDTNDKQATLIESLEKELTDQPPPAPLMTTQAEQELLELLNKKDSLINKQKGMIDGLSTTVETLSLQISELDL